MSGEIIPETPEEEAGALGEAPVEDELKKPGDMTEEELDTFLSGEEPVESQPPVEGEEGGEEGAPPEEEPPVEGEKEEPPTGDIKASPEIEALKAEVTKLQKKTDNQDKFFDRIGTEVGLLRKKAPAEVQEELEKIRDAYAEDAVEGHRLMEEYRTNQVKTEGLHREYAANKMAEGNREALSQKLPDLEKPEVVEELAAMMAEDGAPPQAVEVFKSQPYYMTQDTLYNLYQRNTLSKENAGLKERLEAKDKEIAELKGKPEQLLKSIEKAAGNKTLSGKQAGAGGKKTATTTTKPTRNMTEEELNNVLKGD